MASQVKYKPITPISSTRLWGFISLLVSSKIRPWIYKLNLATAMMG